MQIATRGAGKDIPQVSSRTILLSTRYITMRKLLTKAIKKQGFGKNTKTNNIIKSNQKVGSKKSIIVILIKFLKLNAKSKFDILINFRPEIKKEG